jgi:hypothetical protein
MRRPPVHEWAVLGEDGDPVPGDPDAVALLGLTLKDTADDIWREAGEIKALASVEAWKSKAADTFRDAADEAEGTLRKAYHRYHAAAEAMGTQVRDGSEADWASALELAQQMAAKALKDAQAADTVHRAAATKIGMLPSGTAPTDPALAGLKKKQADADSALADAKSALRAAKDVRDKAAKAAQERIHRAITHDGLHDSRWEKISNSVGNALSDVGHFLEDAGEVVVSDLASIGNAMAHDVGAVMEVLGGIGLATLGAGGELGGLVLDATGIGAVLGVPAGVVSAAAIAGGLGLATAGLGTIARDAAGPDRVNMSSDAGGGRGGGDWSTPAEGDSAPVSEEERAAFTQRRSDLSGLSKNKQVAEVRKGVEADGQKYKPEGALLRGAKHGIDWSEGPQRATTSGKPQGQFGSPADVDFATRKASQLGPGKEGFFELPPDNGCIEYLPDGTTRKPNAIFVKVRPDGTVHAYPLTK